jgi:hypothetical protein
MSFLLISFTGTTLPGLAHLMAVGIIGVIDKDFPAGLW